MELNGGWLFLIFEVVNEMMVYLNATRVDFVDAIRCDADSEEMNMEY